jgi:NADH-quinone oxidoreductase subunit I
VKSPRSFLRRVLLPDIGRGLWITLRYYFSRKVTIPYPEKVQAPAERFRGLLRLTKDGAGGPLCIACKACQRICPTSCFDIEGLKAEGAKTMRPVRFDWRLDRCTFCGLCVEVCPTAAIRFSHEFELAAVARESLFFRLPEMYIQGQDLQDRLCGGCRP